MKKFVLKNGETRFQKAETRFKKAETRFQNAKTALSRIFFARTGMDSAAFRNRNSRYKDTVTVCCARHGCPLTLLKYLTKTSIVCLQKKDIFFPTILNCKELTERDWISDQTCILTVKEDDCVPNSGSNPWVSDAALQVLSKETRNCARVQPRNKNSHDQGGANSVQIPGLAEFSIIYRTRMPLLA